MALRGQNPIAPADLEAVLEAAGAERLPWMAEAADMLTGPPAPVGCSGRGLVRLFQWLDRNLPLNLAWCGLFVRHCLKTAFPGTRLPLISLRARPYLDFGIAAEPQFGALLIFWLIHPRSPFGHVGFYWAEDDECFHVLGGNQRDDILIERFPKDRLIGCRWPEEAGPPPGLRRRASKDDATDFELGWFF